MHPCVQRAHSIARHQVRPCTTCAPTFICWLRPFGFVRSSSFATGHRIPFPHSLHRYRVGCAFNRNADDYSDQGQRPVSGPTHSCTPRTLASHRRRSWRCMKPNPIFLGTPPTNHILPRSSHPQMRAHQRPRFSAHPLNPSVYACTPPTRGPSDCISSTGWEWDSCRKATPTPSRRLQSSGWRRCVPPPAPPVLSYQLRCRTITCSTTTTCRVPFDRDRFADAMTSPRMTSPRLH